MPASLRRRAARLTRHKAHLFAARLDSDTDLFKPNRIEVLKPRSSSSPRSCPCPDGARWARRFERLAASSAAVRDRDVPASACCAAVGKLDQHDAMSSTIASIILRRFLLRFFFDENRFADLRDAFDDVRNLLAEFLFDFNRRDDVLRRNAAARAIERNPSSCRPARCRSRGAPVGLAEARLPA